MLTHKRIRERQAECRAMYAAGSMNTADYVGTMNRLNAELKIAEEKMYAVADNLDQIDLLRFIAGTIPAAFKKIHARFPHLTFDEVVEFEQTVRTAGGSIMTHSGMFVPIQRDMTVDNSGCRVYNTYISWSCCHTLFHIPAYMSEAGYSKVFGILDATNPRPMITIHSAKLCKMDSSYKPKIDEYRQIIYSNDHVNSDPCGRCDSPSLFSLSDETDASVPSQEIENSIAEIKSATQTQIDKIEAEISDLRRKAGDLNDLLKTLDVSSDSKIRRTRRRLCQSE